MLFSLSGDSDLLRDVLTGVRRSLELERRFEPKRNARESFLSFTGDSDLLRDVLTGTRRSVVAEVERLRRFEPKRDAREGRSSVDGDDLEK